MPTRRPSATDVVALRRRVGARGVEVSTLDHDPPFHTRPGDDVVHPVERAQERALAAPGRPDERRHQVFGNLDVDRFEGALRAVEKVECFNRDRRRHIRRRGGA